MSTDGGGGKRRRLPRVVALVGPDHDEDLDDIDPNIKARLEGQVQWVTPAEAFEEGTDVEGALIGNHGTVGAAVRARLGDRLAVVSNYGVGIDHINVADCDAAGVKVCGVWCVVCGVVECSGCGSVRGSIVGGGCETRCCRGCCCGVVEAVEYSCGVWVLLSGGRVV